MKFCKRWQTATRLGFALLLIGCDSSRPIPVPETSTGAPTASLASTTPSSLESDALNSDSLRTADPQSATPPQRDSGNSGAPRAPDEIDLSQRSFMTLQPITSSSPEELIAHLRQIDSALQDLVLAGSHDFLDEQTFKQSGLRLGRMKQAAGLQLAQSPESSVSESKAGVIAQLVALSHMSGLGDVPAAQELERFAGEMSTSADADLAHQAQVVMIGFELQSLQNGVRSTPETLLSQVDKLFARPEDRGFPEFMVLQQAQQVLHQMGFGEAADQVKEKVIEAYRTSPDPQLRGEAWLIETQESQAYQNFLQAFRGLGSESFDSAAALVALRGLYEEFPSLQTLEQIASTIANIEYSGQVALSQDVAKFTQQTMADYSSQEVAGVKHALDAHAARTALLGHELPLVGLIGFDGQPLLWDDYQGKVVLVDFWASWCVKCMRELPGIRQCYTAYADRGFDVLSVNMDENLASGRTFVEQQHFPWRSFHSDDPQAIGFKSPLAQQLGVNAIPFMLIIGRDGRVAALHVRGEQLKPAIAKLIEATP
ncbi:MAG: TlpA family protein disulfide reductase [Planctomycetales bacterium]|nr:TlpA family protein disulfide reductase [Planctomycetales bacterium]